jgi:hypothetical protein
VTDGLLTVFGQVKINKGNTAAKVQLNVTASGDLEVY